MRRGERASRARGCGREKSPNEVRNDVMLLYTLSLPCSSSSSTSPLSSHFLFSRLLCLLSALMAPLSINPPSLFCPRQHVAPPSCMVQPGIICTSLGSERRAEVTGPLTLEWHIHLKPRSKCRPKADFQPVQISSWRLHCSVNSHKSHQIRFLQIPLEVVSNGIWTDASQRFKNTTGF